MTPEKIAKFDQATASVDEIIRGTVNEVRSQFADGYAENDIMLGLHDYLNNYTVHTRGEFATLYMRAVLKLAKSGESI